MQTDVDIVKLAADRSKELEDIAQAALQEAPDNAGDLKDAEDVNALALHLANLERMADTVEAQAKRFCEATRKRVLDMMRFYGDSLRALTQDAIGKKSPRAWQLPLVLVKLRKSAVRIHEQDGDEAKKAFRKWDSAQENAFTRIQVRMTLTRAQLNHLIDQIDEETLSLVKYEIEAKKNELQERFKATGEVPAGFEVKGGEDQVLCEFKPALPGGEVIP